MEKFKRVHMMVTPDGKNMSVEEFSRLYYGSASLRVYLNSKYTVVKRVHKTDDKPSYVWLSIKRNDKEAIHDWRDLQEIKNELVGPECEGVELYPAESRRVDTANQYHLWVDADPKFRFPFGFNERLVSGAQEAQDVGAKQRPFDSRP